MLRVLVHASGQEIAVPAQPNDTILAIKQRIQAQESIPATHCRLVFQTNYGMADKLCCREIVDTERVEEIKLKDTVQLFVGNDAAQLKALEALLRLVKAVQKLEDEKQQERKVREEEKKALEAAWNMQVGICLGDAFLCKNREILLQQTCLACHDVALCAFRLFNPPNIIRCVLSAPLFCLVTHT